MKSWPRQWQTLVALFAEKRKGLKENVVPADFTGRVAMNSCAQILEMCVRLSGD